MSSGSLFDARRRRRQCLRNREDGNYSTVLPALQAKVIRSSESKFQGQSSGAVQTTSDLPAECISVSPQSWTPFKGMFSCAQSTLSHRQTSVITDKEHREAEEPLLVQITLEDQWYNPQCKNIPQPCWENMGPTQLQNFAS